MDIKKSNQKDINKIAKLMMEEFAKPPYNTRYTIQEAKNSIIDEMKKGEIYVINIKEKIIGFVSISYEKLKETHIFIENLVIDNKYQRKGFGKKLIKFIEEKYKNTNVTITLSVNKKSEAYKFYKNLGYKENKINVNMSKKIQNNKNKKS